MRLGILVAVLAALFSAVPASAAAWYFDITANVTAQTHVYNSNFGNPPDGSPFERIYTDNFLFTARGIADAFSGSGTITEYFAKQSCSAPYHDDQRSGYQYCSFSGTLTFVGNQIFGTNLQVYQSGSGCGGMCGVQLFGTAPTFSVSYVGSDSGPGTAPVPEPSAWLLFMVGFGIIGSALRRRGRARYWEPLLTRKLPA